MTTTIGSSDTFRFGLGFALGFTARARYMHLVPGLHAAISKTRCESNAVVATLLNVTSQLQVRFRAFVVNTSVCNHYSSAAIDIESSMDVMASITLLNGHSFKLLPTTKSTPILSRS